MLQASDATVDDFAGREGCNEILNVIRPDILAGIHEAYRQAGAEWLPPGSIARSTSLERVDRAIDSVPPADTLEAGVISGYSRGVSEDNNLVMLGPVQPADALIARHPQAKYLSV
jgi:hypothetical protein